MAMQFESVVARICNGAASRAPAYALAAGLLLFASGPAMSLPPNPERPNNAKTCAEAQERLREAEQGSSLVSKQENAEILERARAVAVKLCPDVAAQE